MQTNEWWSGVRDGGGQGEVCVAIKGLHMGHLCGDGMVCLGYAVYMSLHVW